MGGGTGAGGNTMGPQARQEMQMTISQGEDIITITSKDQVPVIPFFSDEVPRKCAWVVNFLRYGCSEVQMVHSAVRARSEWKECKEKVLDLLSGIAREDEAFHCTFEEAPLYIVNVRRHQEGLGNPEIPS